MAISLTNMNGRFEIQTIPNVRGAYQYFEILGGKIEISPNFKGVNSNLG